MQQTIVREMSITHDEFFRLLPNALKNLRYEKINNNVYTFLDSGNLKITLLPQSERIVGSLKLPVTTVKFTFENCTDSIQEKFFMEFDLAYQKGGG